jgi:hypothetical protein
MEEYVKKFELLLIRCELMEPQEQTIARFLGELRKDISNVFELKSYIFLEEFVKLATRVERQQKRRGVRTSVTTSSTTKVVSTPTRTWSTPKRDEKVEFSKGNTSFDSLKEKRKGDRTSTS